MKNFGLYRKFVGTVLGGAIMTGAVALFGQDVGVPVAGALVTVVAAVMTYFMPNTLSNGENVINVAMEARKQ